MNLGQRAELFGVEDFVACEVACLDTEQIFNCSRHVMTFTHLGNRRNSALKGFLAGLGMVREANTYIGGKSRAYSGLINHRAIARNNSAFFEILYTTQAGAGREADVLGEVEIADPPIQGQLAQYLLVDWIICHHMLCIFPNIHSFRKDIRQGLCDMLQMDMDNIKSLMVFAFVMSATPGPNNLMLMASGANFGLVRTLPHMLGVALGFVIMAILVGLGLIQIFDLFPSALFILKVAATLFMIFLAYKIATASPPKEQEAKGTPMRFYQAVLFQWVNPKAIGMAVSSMSLYATDQTLAAVLWVALVFGSVNFPSVSLWAVLGVQMQRVLTNPVRMRIFNGVMALLLLLSVIPMLRADL